MREPTILDRASPIRQLDVFAVYSKPTGHFVLVNQATGEQAQFNALPSALAATLARHQAAVDQQNRRWLGMAIRS